MATRDTTTTVYQALTLTAGVAAAGAGAVAALEGVSLPVVSVTLLAPPDRARLIKSAPTRYPAAAN
jgi:hypothetical protein